MRRNPIRPLEHAVRPLPTFDNQDGIGHSPLCPSSTDEIGFASEWVSALLFQAQSLRAAPDSDERWSLAECCVAEEDWTNILDWGKRCPEAAVPRPETLVGSVMFLAFSAAVARTLDSTEGLWDGVAARMSPALRSSYFGSSTYPSDATRECIREVCERRGLRHQTDMPGKHRYWRTVMLQIGFAPRAAVDRLPLWLSGYSLPESVSTLLQEGDVNGSIRFRALWGGLRLWHKGTFTDKDHHELVRNPWFPISSKHLLRDLPKRNGYWHASQLRVEDEDDRSSLFGAARLKADAFQLELASTLPARFLSETLSPFQVRVGTRTLDLIPQKDGRLGFEGVSAAKVGRESRELDVKAFQAGDLVHRERVHLWLEEDDVTIFNGKTGQRVRDLRGFVPEASTSYTVLTPADVVLIPASPQIESANDEWRFHIFSEGLPTGLTAMVDGFPIWRVAKISNEQRVEKAGSLEVRADAMTHVTLRALASKGRSIRSFRVAGRTFIGASGSMTLSPTMKWDGRMVPAILDDGNRVELEVSVQEEPTGGAYVDEAGIWVALMGSTIVDGAELEGRNLAVSWDRRNQQECWLMLGDQPLRSQPDMIRRQHMRGMGEPLWLRFGLMIEQKAGVMLASSTMYCGHLKGVMAIDGWYQLSLRDASMRAGEYRVHVWERGRAVPRVLDPSEVECNEDGTLLTVMAGSVPNPLGWAISFERLWKGSCFHVKPAFGDKVWDEICAGWLDVFEVAGKKAGLWDAVAVYLRWWKFPVLMEPFFTSVAARVTAAEARTFGAWLREKEGGNILCPGTDNDYLVPFRTLLWRFCPESSICSSLLAGLWRKESGMFADSRGVLFPELRFLLHSHPILLARMVCEVVWQIEREELMKVPTVPPDSSPYREKDKHLKANVERQSAVLFHLFCQAVSAFGGVTSIDRSAVQQLEAKALDDLRCWTDKTSLDSKFFSTYIIHPAEALFRMEGVPDEQLRIAVSRSPASRAFLACHLVTKFGIREGL